MKKPGVLAVGGANDTKGSTYYTNWNQYGSSTLLAVRDRFCAGTILFGGIECVGALEEDVYQDLVTGEDGTGFGIAPVPMYKDFGADSDVSYLTSIHNVGRPGAITKTTSKFAQCTAFLNYQSTHSDKILETYYTMRMEFKLAGDNIGTAEMLDFIRNHVRTSFDKIMEDAIEFKNPVEDGAENRRWHSILLSASYQLDIRGKYTQYVGIKEGFLENLRKSYSDCPP